MSYHIFKLPLICFVIRFLAELCGLVRERAPICIIPIHRLYVLFLNL